MKNKLKRLAIFLWSCTKTLVKCTLIALIVITILLFLVSKYDKYSTFDVKEEIKNYSVIIYGKKHQGSGVIIKSDRFGTIILTNKHICTKNKKTKKRNAIDGIIEYHSFTIEEASDKKYGPRKTQEAQVLKIAQNYDLCQLYMLIPNLKAAPIAWSIPKNGSKLYSYSSPQNIPGVFSEGKSLGIKMVHGFLDHTSTTFSDYGSSGGGVFNEKGELVALINMVNKKKRLTFMVPLPHILHFIGR